MFDRFTDRAKKVVNLARQEAQKYNHRELMVEHLLLGLAQESTGAAANVLMNLGINIVDLRKKVESVMVGSPASIPNGQMPFSALAKKALEAAAEEAKGLGHGYIGTEHILLGILRTDTISAKILKDQGINSENTRGEVLEFLGQDESDNGPGMPVAPGNGSKTPAIDAFCRDLTQLAKEAKLDPVIGRENEVERVIQILSRRTKNNPVIIGDAGVGKAQPVNTPVLTPNGWVPIGTLKVNDEVMTPDGKPTKITGVYPQGIIPVFMVKFKDGRETKACGNHLWNVYANHNSRKVDGKTKHDYTWKVVTTESLISRFKTRKSPKIKVQLTSKQPLWEDKTLPVHPYVLGVLLGNGSFPSNNIDNIKLTTSDNYISDKINNLISPCYKLAFSENATNEFRIVRKNSKNVFGKIISEMGLDGKDSYNKFIPDAYKNGSVETRQLLVQGMMDTDGYIGKNGNLSYSTSSLQLAEDFIYVIRSLGGVACKKEKRPSYSYKGVKKQGKINYNISFRLSDQASVVSLPRKVSRLSKNYQYKDNLKLEIIAIEKCANEESVCIKVEDKNELYITNDFIVTHNTAIIEGIAQRIVANDIPENMASKRVVTLDLALMLAGTKYRGQFEERLKTLVMEVRKAGNILLFIDEIHTLVGAGANEGGMDAANILKPALSRGELQCIGATTLGEYRKSIEKDGALERRFQSVIVEPPSTENTVKILNGLKERYENHHNVSYSKEAIDEAVHLADRYITARNFPDKAIDVIDEAGARTRIKSSYLPPEVRAAQAEAKKLQLEKEEAIKNQEFEKAAALRDQLAKVNEALAGQAVDTSRHMVTPKEIQETVSKMTGVPLARLEKTEMEQLLGMEGILNVKIINQSEAVSAISRSIRRSRSGLKDPKRPIGSFLFLGQSGVGKTYLTKQLAKFMFGTEEAVIPIDMSEYMEKHNASRLIGAPPGYVGYEEGGQLTEKVRRRPYSVILLDEVEKAHPDVFNLLLQVFEEGRLTDSLGRVVDFRNTIIVMTSNIGSNLMLGSPGLGFNTKDNASQEEKKKRIKNTVLGEVQRYFRPEFLNRIDELIVFNPLQESDLMQILELQLKDVLARASDKGLTVNLTDSTKKFLITEGHTVEYGARPMRRAIEKFIEDPLAEYLLRNQDTAGTINFDIVDNMPAIIPTVDTVKRKPKKVTQ